MPAPSPPTETYQKFLRKCLVTRTPVDRFETFFTQLLARSPIPPSSICTTILSSQLTANASDPLHIEYVGRLVERDIVSLADVLVVLLKTSSAKSASSTSPAGLDSSNSAENRELMEQDLLLMLAAVLRSHRPRSSETVWAAVQALSEWMEAVMTASGTGMLEEPGADVMVDAAAAAGGIEGKGRREALAELLIALGGNSDAVRVLGEGGRKERKLSFQSSLSLFIQYIQVQNPALASRLETLRQQQQTQPSPQQTRRDGVNGKPETIDGMMMGLGDGGESTIPIVWARGHLFVWLNSLVRHASFISGRPHLDDEAIVGYLYSRYKDDVNNMLIDFITAVIDTVSNALVRNEPASTLFLLRSFLINKVPLLLARLSPSPATASFAITQSFMRTDISSLSNIAPPLFDPYSSSHGGNSDMLGLLIDLRQEFLFACALQNVILEADIQNILGELPLGALPASGRYDVQDLLGQCQMDPTRTDRLLDEIDAFEGNSGAVVVALFEIMKNMCESRETMPLKNICGALTRKPSSLDVMLLFVKLPELLEPLCELLDTWRYEEDQGEYQPVYEEFGFILLMVLTLVHRYDLTPSDLTSSNPVSMESFIPQLILKGSTAQRIENLGSSDHRHAQLGGWIKELFEGEGISDGLMSSCRPQDFYLLVPSLFMQSVLACERGVIDLETLKEGFSYLLVPFLLPSLVGGLGWLARHLWSSTSDLAIPLQTLSSLLMPNISPENQELHRTVISTAAHDLTHILRELLRSNPTPPQDQVTLIEKMLAFLKPHSKFRRNGSASRDELEMWSRNAGSGGLAGALSSVFHSLISWSINQTAEMVLRPPHAYSHRMLFAGWKILGAVRIINILVNDIIKDRVDGSSQGYAEDVAVAIILAFLPGDRMGLPEGLKTVEEEAVLKPGGDTVRSEVLVGLVRKVDMQCTPYSPVQVQRVNPAMEMDVAAAAANATGMGGSVEEAVDLGGLGMEDGMEGLLMEGDFVGGMDLGDVSGMDLG